MINIVLGRFGAWGDLVPSKFHTKIENNFVPRRFGWGDQKGPSWDPLEGSQEVFGSI